jgi:hypothetical protein
MIPCVFDDEMLSVVRIISRRLELEVVDHTGQFGAFWIVGGIELSTLLAPLGMRFMADGANASKKRPAWYGRVLSPSAAAE